MLYILPIAAALGGMFLMVKVIGVALARLFPEKKKSIDLNVDELAPILGTFAALAVFLTQLDQILS